ncbi:MAG: hypothetical protein FD152_3694 [Xanthobacteraceae bacterium]|nr:MAG: hypothetical protein FD152_3694 [Xanthobacteraceae bacterium]
MTAPPRFNAGPETRGITITVNERVYAGLVDMARAAARTPNVQAQLLFEAAYSARCKPTGDRDLDAAVAAMDEPAPLGSPLPEEMRVTGIRHASLDEGGGRDPFNPAHHGLPMAVIAIAARVAAEAMGGGMAEAPAAAVTETENDHVDDAPAAPQATAMEAPPQAAPDAMGVTEGEAVEPVSAAAEPAGAPVETLCEPVGLAAPAVVGAGEPADTPPATAAVPSEPLISSATLKYMRTLKFIGNSMDEIADMVGLPVKAVREALAGKAR